MKALFERFDRSRQPPSSHLSQQTDFPSQPRPSSCFREQFGSALQDYEGQTGINLVDHPLTRRLQDCHTVEDVMGVLREEVQGIDDLHGENYGADDGRLMNSLKGAVYVLYNLSINTVLGEVIDLVRRRTRMSVSCL